MTVQPPTGNGRDLVVALAGNPNTGKSSIFNGLTGASQHVGNWPGKTVAEAHGTFTVDDVRVHLVDLPGTYTLDAVSPEEVIARDFLVSGGPDAVVIVLDASNLERNLYLAVQILEIGLPSVVALTMVDVAEARGLGIDPAALSRELGVPVVPLVARTRVGIDRLAAATTTLTPTVLASENGTYGADGRQNRGDEGTRAS